MAAQGHDAFQQVGGPDNPPYTRHDPHVGGQLDCFRRSVGCHPYKSKESQVGTARVGTHIL